MSNYVVNDDIKNQILDLYFNKNETMQKISETTGITRNTISKILHFDKKEVNLLQEVGANVEEGKEYTENEIKVFRNEVISYIINHSKNKIVSCRGE